jgi:AbrB family looped-hinge helix DNA binding protein
MLAAGKLSTKGQIVIPKKVRDELGLLPGDPLAIGVSGDRIVLRKITLRDLLQESERNRQKGKTLSHEETFRDLI